ncbi:hypothetical protein SCAR479_05223 [Seiridium cardinale]|uniref:Uncharacterized protein n=1 Tax=Seiridium cardinale TaxID=138064 RepID=A0ABR2XWR3_9PEZI
MAVARTQKRQSISAKTILTDRTTYLSFCGMLQQLSEPGYQASGLSAVLAYASADSPKVLAAAPPTPTILPRIFFAREMEAN